MLIAKRIQLDFSEEAYQKLRSMAERAVRIGTQKNDTNAETIRMALGLYRWYLKTIEEGWKVQIERDGHVKEVDPFIK